MQFIRSDEFKAAYRRLTAEERQRVKAKPRLFAQDFRHPSLRANLWSREPREEWYFRVSRDIRLFYRMQGDTCILITVGHHDIERRR